MGTETNPYGLYVPDPDEPGPTWGAPVADNFNKINAAMLANANAIIAEVAARQAAITAALAAGSVKQPVRVVAVAGNIILSGLQSIDSVALAAGDSVLVTAQTNPVDNGIYVAGISTWARRSDADAQGELVGGSSVWIQEGATYHDSYFELKSNGNIIPGTDPQDWAGSVGGPGGFGGLSTVNTWTNTNDFTGGLTKNGANVATTAQLNPAGKNPITGYYHFGDNGGDRTLATDSATALQTLIDSLPYGSTVLLDGYFKIALRVKWRSGISMKAISTLSGGLRSYNVDVPPIAWGVTSDGANAGAPLTDVTFENFEIDCSNQTLSSGYNVGAKCIAIQYMKRCHIRGLYCHDSHASAIGCDFMSGGSTITGNVVVNPGRSHSTTAPNTAGGGAGIGYGCANSSNEEPLVIANNTVIGQSSSTPNASYGIFMEAQSSSQTPQTSGIRVIGNYVSGCQVGIGDSGARRTVISSNQITACTAGISVDQGTFGGAHASYDGIAIGNNIYACTGPAIQFDSTGTGGAGKYAVIGNALSNCNQGVMVKMASTFDGYRFTILNNQIHDNKYSGIRVYYSAAGTGVLRDTVIAGNVVYNNGTNANAGDRDGIRIEVPCINVKIDQNVCYDAQTTKTQAYGLILTAAATFTGGSVRNNDFRNNLTAGASIATTFSTTSWVAANGGMTPPAPSAVGLSASPMTYTAPDFPGSLFISGGTVTDIKVGGVTVGAATETAIPTEASDQVTLTYTGTPVLTWRAR